MEHMKTHGWCKIRCISAEKAKEFEDAFFEWFEGFSTEKKITRDNPDTWRGRGTPNQLHGIFKEYQVGHTQFMWDARVEMEPIFRKYWKTSQLLTSFDGCCLIPPRVGISDKTTSWLHFDQGAKIKVTKEVEKQFEKYKFGPPTGKFVCVQGILNIVDCGPKDGGLYVADGSHLGHNEFFEKFGRKDHIENWYLFKKPTRFKDETDDDYAMRVENGKKFMAQYPRVKVEAKAGEAILFYSTLAHCAQQTEHDNDTHRLAFYISMLPKELATKTELQKKREYLENLRTTSHWACLGLKVNGEFPRSYGSDDGIVFNYPPQNFKFPTLTPKMKQLAGLNGIENVTFVTPRVHETMNKRKYEEEDE